MGNYMQAFIENCKVDTLKTKYDGEKRKTKSLFEIFTEVVFHHISVQCNVFQQDLDISE